MYASGFLTRVMLQSSDESAAPVLHDTVACTPVTIVEFHSGARVPLATVSDRGCVTSLVKKTVQKISGCLSSKADEHCFPARKLLWLLSS